MLSLPQVTLCCVDTRMPQMAMEAMMHCMADIAFGNAILFTQSNHRLEDAPSSLRIVELNHVNTIEAYSNFLVKEIGHYIETTHFLIVQWDGYVLNPGLWDENFLNYDYIGAVWPQYHDNHRVGNGGFSLRSKKLQNALIHPEIKTSHPEDVCIARDHRSLLESWGIKFADEHVARRFAFERELSLSSSFGFHGLSNMALILDEAELGRFMSSAPDSLFSSVEARGFIKRLIQRGMKKYAHNALRKRRVVKSLDFADLRLWARWMTA